MALTPDGAASTTWWRHPQAASGGGESVAKNTGRGHRNGAVRGRSEFQHNGTWFKRDTATGRIMNGSPDQHKGVRNEKN